MWYMQDIGPRVYDTLHVFLVIVLTYRDNRLMMNKGAIKHLDKNAETKSVKIGVDN